MAKFNLSALKPGDEVGITWTVGDSEPTEFISRVTAIEDDGFIRVERQELPFWPDDGREVEIIWDGVVTPSPHGTRLCEPSDEGRRNSLGEEVDTKLDTLRDRLIDLSLEDLRRLEATIDGLLSEYPERVVIDLPIGGEVPAPRLTGHQELIA